MGVRQWRLLRPFSGMRNDLLLRRPWYISDWVGKEDVYKDAATIYKVLSGTVRIFFINLLPALAYSLDMFYRTGDLWSTNEVLLASAIPACFFAIFSCQPLTIVGVTGLIDLFGYTTYNIVTVRYGVPYLEFMAWVGIWSALMHFAIAIFNWCDYMKYVTDFSSQAFGMYVGIIYILKGIELIVEEFHGEGTSLANGYLSCLVALLYFALTWATTWLGSSQYMHRYIRSLCTDYSLIIWTIFFAGFVHIPGDLSNVNIRKYPISQAYAPSVQRNWFLHFWTIDVKWWFIAIPFAALVTALFYYDHNVSSLMAQARQYPLRKHAGFHWDFFLLGITTLVAGFIGIPYPNGLVPQAPVHTDSCAMVEYPKGELEDGEKKKGPRITRILEQRWTHFGMGLLLFGMMTRPMLVVLSTVPRAVFAGVFITVGWSSIETNPVTIRTLGFLHSPVRTVTQRRRATLYFLLLQWVTIGAEVAISQTIAAIGFPVIILLLIPLRWTWMLRWFTHEELAELDVPTAEADVVLMSLGGAPDIAARTRPLGSEQGKDGCASASGSTLHMDPLPITKDRAGKSSWCASASGAAPGLVATADTKLRN
ncbi:HCO3 transporter family protein [Protomyces lactucae-debilis]|uniref:HCO3 transporter family protein n=1 Tax=Protomyces lactucae-debilis TaxID=2754530 RepID=A0A1Y2ERC2_PROLT|nr:HCO3 transporter family protein [Protomyces lactucae-debilis]ORY73385.1 HCO3 transporter family protein [Protomyces lactucae-debilis]